MGPSQASGLGTKWKWVNTKWPEASFQACLVTSVVTLHRFCDCKLMLLWYALSTEIIFGFNCGHSRDPTVWSKQVCISDHPHLHCHVHAAHSRVSAHNQTSLSWSWGVRAVTCTPDSNSYSTCTKWSHPLPSLMMSPFPSGMAPAVGRGGHKGPSWCLSPPPSTTHLAILPMVYLSDLCWPRCLSRNADLGGPSTLPRLPNCCPRPGFPNPYHSTRNSQSIFLKPKSDHTPLFFKFLIVSVTTFLPTSVAWRSSPPGSLVRAQISSQPPSRCGRQRC